jgi:hypothetical protein
MVALFYNFKKYLKSNNHGILNILLGIATITGGILGIPDIQGWIFLIVFYLLLIFIHFSIYLSKGLNNNYHYLKKIEEAHVSYQINTGEIEKKINRRKETALTISAISVSKQPYPYRYL